MSGALCRGIVTTVCVLTLAALTSRATAASERYEFSRILMGTKVRVVLWSDDQEQARRAAEAALDRIQTLDDVLSDWRPTSELSRLVDAAGDAPRVVSGDLFTALQQSVAMASASNGAFDPTVAPSVALWREARATETMPSEDRLDAARDRVDWRRLELEPDDATARLAEPGMGLDLGGIGKGIAADEAFHTLRRRGATRVLVDVGGSIRAGSPPPDHEGWAINATSDGRRSDRLQLHNASVATSGDLEQFVELDGTRYSHIVDPRTGRALEDRIAVTVVAPDAGLADALATALCVLGPGDGAALVRSFDDTAVLFERTRSVEDGPRRWALGALPPDCRWPAFDRALATPGAAANAVPATRVGRAPGVVRLEIPIISMRRIDRDAPGPVLELAGVTHIADAGYYDALQTRLDAADVVLFESVMPVASRPPGGDSAAERVEQTQAALDLLAGVVARVRDDGGRVPADLDELARAAGALDSRLPAVVRGLRLDAWGGAVEYRAPAGVGAEVIEPWVFRSLGADGAVGGEGENADLTVDALPTRGSTPNDMQKELANALGLAHQIEVIDYDRPNWILSDMAMEEVQASLTARGVDMGPLDDMLQGSSLPATVARGMLRLIRFADMLLGGRAAGTVKVLLVEMLGSSDLDRMTSTGLGPDLVEVIIDERNQVVVDDLVRLLDGPDAPGDGEVVAIFYGAGHLPDLIERLRDQLGYDVTGLEFLPAIEVDLKASGLRQSDVAAMRRMVDTMMKQSAMQQSAPRGR